MKTHIYVSFLIISVCFGVSEVEAQNAELIKSPKPQKQQTGPVEFKTKKFNVLFIAVDDLKPDLNCFGFSSVKSPNIDKLAASSTIFTGAFCQQAVCGPTRASLLTGVRPDKTQVWDLQTLIRDKNPDIVTLPQLFKSSGYKTIGMGKIFDPRSVDKGSDSISWSVPFKRKFKLAEGFEDLAYETYQATDKKAMEKAGIKMGGGEETQSEAKTSNEHLNVPDDAYMDGAMANYAIGQLRENVNAEKPFFIAVGFKKPHLPFVAPQKYWDLYDRSKITLAEWQQKSIDGPDIAYHNSGELRNFNDISPLNDSKKNDLLQLSKDKQRELIHGYYACISYVDAQIGKIIDALKATGLDKNTIVVIWGDHGWHLGDHSLWCKHSNFEQATRVPLILTVPGLTNGKKYKKPVEFVDVFPTLCDLNGLPIAHYLDGKSLLPALKNNDVDIKNYSISQYPRGAGKGLRETMGYSLRTTQFRFTEWVGNYFNTAKDFNPNDVSAVELYDLEKDPNETRNVAKDPKYKNIVLTLSNELHNYYDAQHKTAGIIK